MRRSDREITDLATIREYLQDGAVCHLALNDDGAPYVVPLNYGYELRDDGAMTLYFHGAKAGKKYELMQRDPAAAFSICSYIKVFSEDPDNPDLACEWSARYSSVLGSGTIREVDDLEEKRAALEKLMGQAAGRKGFHYSEAALAHTGVFVLDVAAYTAKSNRR